MKRILIYIIIGMGLLTACKSESSNNGDLDGFWQMTGRPGLTWSFQGKILEFRDVNSVLWWRSSSRSDSLPQMICILKATVRACISRNIRFSFQT